MTIQEAINKLDENIPEPNNKMVDLEHFPIAVAWETVKEELAQARKETARDMLKAIKNFLDEDDYNNYYFEILAIAMEYGVEVE